MKIATLIARYLLGVLFVVFSLNYWLHFIPAPAPEAGTPAGDFSIALAGSGYLTVVKLLELLGGILLLVGRYVNLGLAMLGPIVVNIALFHIFLMQGGYGMMIFIVLLAVVALAGRRDFIKTLMAPK